MGDGCMDIVDGVGYVEVCVIVESFGMVGVFVIKFDVWIEWVEQVWCDDDVVFGCIEICYFVYFGVYVEDFLQ